MLLGTAQWNSTHGPRPTDVLLKKSSPERVSMPETFGNVQSQSLSLIVQRGWFSFSFFLSINGKIKVLIVYNFCVSLKQENEKKKSYAFTATFLVCITDVAQMMCMFYI